MYIKESAGVKGKKNPERIDPKLINDDFVVDFPLSTAQKRAIEVIYNMRSVRISQLCDILGYSYQHMTREMLKLHLNRFVERMFPPNGDKGPTEAYFLLDQAGAIFIAGYYELALKDVVWNRRDNLIKMEKLNHTFHIGEVRASIEKEAREKGHKVLNCVSDRHLYLSYEHEGKKYTIRPDMFFQYIDKEMQYSYFVEVDLGTMAITANSRETVAFENKVPYYEAYKLSGQYKSIYNGFPRILVITTTTDRAEKLKEAVREKQKTRVEFLFTTFSLWKEQCTGPIFLNTEGIATNIFK